MDFALKNCNCCRAFGLPPGIHQHHILCANNPVIMQDSVAALIVNGHVIAQTTHEF